MLDLSSRKVYGALAEQCVGGDAKADKVENATSGHLAGLDSNGNLTDSGVSPTEDVTVEGNPVTFNSPFEQDAKSVVVSVKPIQDLHGYDHPWVGGAGINKFDISQYNPSVGNGFTASKNNDTGLVTISGTYTGTNAGYGFFLFDTPYIAGTKIVMIDANASMTGNSLYWNDTTNGKIVCNLYNLVNGQSYTFTFKVMAVDENLSPTIWYPYSNICPISGIDEVEIGVSDGESEPTTTTIPLPSTLYGGTVDVTNGDADDNKGFIEFDGSNDEAWQSFGSLSNVTRGAILLSGAKSTSLTTKELSNYLRCISAYNLDEMHYYIYNDYLYVFLPVADGDQFRAYLAEHPLQVCYELATPTTISFDPTDIELLEGTNVVSTNAEKVAVTYGRSLWQDIDELKTDTDGKLDKSDVATIEGDTASKAYSVNDFMLRADGFYRVTAPIAQNASITASNTTKTTIGAVLTALLNA